MSAAIRKHIKNHQKKSKKQQLQESQAFSSLLPFSSYLDDNYVATEDGGFLALYELFPADISCLSANDLIALVNIWNTALLSLDSSFSLWLSMQRQPYEYDINLSPSHPVLERHFAEISNSLNGLYYSSYHLCIHFFDSSSKGLKFLTGEKEELFAVFKNKVENFISLLAEYYHIQALDYAGIVTHLYHRIYLQSDAFISPYDESVDLNSLLSFAELELGLTPKLLGQEMSVVSFSHLGFNTNANNFGSILRFPFPYLISLRWLAQDYLTVESKIAKQEQKLNQKLIKLMPMVLRGEERINEQQLPKLEEISEVKTRVSNREISLGDLSFVVLVPGTLEERSQRSKFILAELAKQGAKGFLEHFNAPEAYLSTIPGNRNINLRRSYLSTKNAAQCLYLSGQFPGRLTVPSPLYPPDSPALCQFQSFNSPFFLNIFVADVGHTLIIGPTGSGKSVLLASMVYGTQQYQDAAVVIFDKGRSLYGTVASLDGVTYDAANITCNPLSLLDSNRDWVFSWLEGLFVYNNIALSITEKNHLQEKLRLLDASANLKDLAALVQIEKVRELLLFYVQDKVWGKIFSGENLHFNNLYSLDIEYLFDKPDYIVYPLLDFLLASVPLSGAPTFIILDEAWFFLRNNFFAAKIVDWLKTARKKNAAVILAMPPEQEIDNAIINSCMTKIFMADAAAETLKTMYASYGLSEADINVLARMRSKRDAYFTSPDGKQVFQVAATATCLTFSQAHQAFIARITDARDKKGWQEDFV